MACGGSASGDLEKVDKMLQMEVPLSPEDRSRTVTLRAEGERLLLEGKQKDALQSLSEAELVLQKAIDASLINKSDG